MLSSLGSSAACTTTGPAPCPPFAFPLRPTLSSPSPSPSPSPPPSPSTTTTCARTLLYGAFRGPLRRTQRATAACTGAGTGTCGIISGSGSGGRLPPIRQNAAVGDDDRVCGLL